MMVLAIIETYKTNTKDLIIICKQAFGNIYIKCINIIKKSNIRRTLSMKLSPQIISYIKNKQAHGLVCFI